MNVLKYISQNGMKHTAEIIYMYKIDIVIQKICGVFLRNKTLKDIIVIESHNDFDSNGGAFYNYLIKNGYNKKYKIVWAIKHPEAVPQELPNNVDWYAEYKPGVKKNYYKWIAKWFTSDQDCSKKLRKEQISIYMMHGSVALKDCTGLINLPEDLNYCLTASEWWKPIDAKQLLWNGSDKRLKICGFPSHDVFYTKQEGDLKKVTAQKYSKTILWMPTFRQNIGHRNDSNKQQVLGVPLIDSLEEYQELNAFLNQTDTLLIIKIHPKQDLESLKIYDMSNICVLTGIDVKKKNIDNYRLMKDVDALISDYSSAAYDFLHADKPIAYDLSDLDSYTRGIVVADPHELMAGHEIKNRKDLYMFVADIAAGKDPYGENRKKLFTKVFKYHDGNSSKRVVELLGL